MGHPFSRTLAETKEQFGEQLVRVWMDIGEKIETCFLTFLVIIVNIGGLKLEQTVLTKNELGR